MDTFWLFNGHGGDDSFVDWNGGGITFIGRIDTPNEGTFIRINFTAAYGSENVIDVVDDSEFCITRWLPRGKIRIEANNGEGNNTPQFSLMASRIDK
jgi:hypothetical protein